MRQNNDNCFFFVNPSNSVGIKLLCGVALMALISSILFPVDFSPSSIAMAPYVKRAAAISNARVSLMHVFDPVSHNGFELYARLGEEIARDHHHVAIQRLEQFLAAEFPVAECPRILLAGDAATGIAHTAGKDFDLIIMPTHAGFFRRMLLGSTVAKVLDAADCPMLTSTHAQTIAPRPLKHREWLCAVGLGENSERVLRYAVPAAAEYGASLTIIHAVKASRPASPVELELAERLESVQTNEALERIANLQSTLGTQVPVRISIGAVKDALLEAARQSDADVLMIGRALPSGGQGRLRDLTYVVVRDSPYPVLSI